jgi:hypothetical protein
MTHSKTQVDSTNTETGAGIDNISRVDRPCECVDKLGFVLVKNNKCIACWFMDVIGREACGV